MRLVTLAQRMHATLNGILLGRVRPSPYHRWITLLTIMTDNLRRRVISYNFDLLESGAGAEMVWG